MMFAHNVPSYKRHEKDVRLKWLPGWQQRGGVCSPLLPCTYLNTNANSRDSTRTHNIHRTHAATAGGGRRSGVLGFLKIQQNLEECKISGFCTFSRVSLQEKCEFNSYFELVRLNQRFYRGKTKVEAHTRLQSLRRQHLRSAGCHQLFVPRPRRSMFGRRDLSVAGPAACNSLPEIHHVPLTSFFAGR